MLKFTKGRGLMVAGVALTLAVAGVAFAFWTGGGSGTGSGAAANGVSGLTANQTTSLTAMYPGDSAQTISGDFDNPNSGPVYVTKVTASISSVTQAVGATGTCDDTDFSLTSPVMNVDTEVPVGSNTGAFNGAKIQFNDKPTVNQDACKGATVHLAYAIS